jgi:predicted dehydrogenase
MNDVGIGIIGAGVRGVYCLGQAIAKLYAETHLFVTGVYDAIPERAEEARRYLEQVYSDEGIDRRVRVYDDYRQMLDDDDCRIVIVTSFTNSHREHAAAAVDSGKEVYLDKPIAVTLTDASRIVRAAETGRIVMGFTRRYEQSWIKAKELLNSGVIGTLQIMQLDSIIPYSRYLQTWHRRRELSGGALNDKCSHHFDVFNWMVDESPAYLTALGGRSSVFPVEDDAPESCRVCTRECQYRRDPDSTSDGGFVLQLDSWSTAREETAKIDTCVYAPGADINDHAIVSIAYPSGIKASLFFSIFGPDTKDQETLTLVGERGKITLVRHEGLVTVDSDFGRTHEEFDCRDGEFETSHFGADRQLVRELRGFHDGREPVATAADGFRSLQMVLAAQESVENMGQPVRFGMESEHTE